MYPIRRHPFVAAARGSPTPPLLASCAVEALEVAETAVDEGFAEVVVSVAAAGVNTPRDEGPPSDVVGGMTEEKKVQKRKVLAKWLKENILRLGPSFIKIGQQFSTRVDILAQDKFIVQD